MQLPATVTLAQANELLLVLQGELSGGSGPLCIDAMALQRFDTSVVALLLQARRLARAAGRDFAVVGAPPRLAELARLYGVEELLSLASSAAAPSSAPLSGLAAA